MKGKPALFAVHGVDGNFEWYLPDGTPLRPPDGTRTELALFHVKWPRYLHAELSALAALQSLTVVELARRILTEYLRPGSWPPLDRRTAKELLQARVDHEKAKRKY